MYTKTSRIFLFFLFLAIIPLQAQDIRFAQHQWRPGYDLRKLGNTIIFQGNNKKKNYFEGWYFKMVAKDGSAIMSVIPGIALSKDGKEQHAFIQTINGVTAETRYYLFPIEAFSFARKGFEVRIGNNYFSKERINLDLSDSTSSVKGEVNMSNLVNYKSGTLLNPGIMGWFRFVPFMECYHGVVSLTHDLQGQLTVDNQVLNFAGGKGYIEKDYGSGMPSAWIWMQSNNFSNPTSSFMLSVATIPWLGRSFNGFLGFFYHDNQMHHFATYRSSKMQVEVPDSSSVNIRINNRNHTLLINARSNNAGMLHAPVQGAMDRRIPESIDATLKITVLDKKGNVVLKDSTDITGLEMVGDYMKLQGQLK